MNMKRIIQALVISLFLILLALVVFLRVDDKARMQPEYEVETEVLAIPSPSVETPESMAAPVTTAAPEPTPDPTPTPTPTPTPEPTPELLTISVIGDLTLTSHQNLSAENPASYAYYMGDDYSYPFKNTVQYFGDDEFTISNLECSFSDQKIYSAQTFYFLAPTAYAQILTAGGVDFVTTANNHALDFGQAGILSTQSALEEYGIPYGAEGSSQIITTEHGLKIGIYCAGTDMAPNKDKAVAAIEQMKAENPDYIICAFHWGQEMSAVTAAQMNVGRACIDAGANLIFGCHTHCLQPIEEYNGGIILYSMGEFSFGGSTSPKDRDTAIFQVTLKRDLDGTISVDGWNAVPCCVSSRPVYEGYTGDNYNDYCPTPYEEGTEDYERVLGKLDGSYTAHYTGTDYSNWYASYG